MVLTLSSDCDTGDEVWYTGACGEDSHAEDRARDFDVLC